MSTTSDLDDAAEAGVLRAIWIKRRRGAPMDSVESAVLELGRGIVGNADQGGRRQVTLLEREVWDGLTSGLGPDLGPAQRRANFLLEGISISGSRDRIMRVGECRLRIRGETRPCRKMDEVVDGLRDVLRASWAGGAFAEVLEGGRVGIGDRVVFES